MSYILDALRKAEAERALGNVPDLHVQAMSALPTPMARQPWKRLLPLSLGAITLGFGVLGYLGWQAMKTSAVSTVAVHERAAVPASLQTDLPKAAVQSAGTQPLPAAAQPSKLEPVTSAQNATLDRAQPAVPAQSVTVASPSHPAPAKATGDIQTAPQTIGSIAQQAGVVTLQPGLKLDDELATPAAGFIDAPSQRQATPARSSSNTSARSPATPASQKMQQDKPGKASAANAASRANASGTDAAPARVTSWRDLPESLRRDMPAVSISGYIYTADPGGRSALINNRLLREGEQVAPGLTLERLLPKSAVLNYQGTRYLQDY